MSPSLLVQDNEEGNALFQAALVLPGLEEKFDGAEGEGEFDTFLGEQTVDGKIFDCVTPLDDLVETGSEYLSILFEEESPPSFFKDVDDIIINIIQDEYNYSIENEDEGNFVDIP